MRPAATQIERFHIGKGATLSKGGRALSSHKCGPNPGVDAICGLRLLLVFFPCSERFFLPVFRFSPLLKNQHFRIPIRPGKGESLTPTGFLGHQYGGSDGTSCENALLQQGAKKCDLL